ncbi:MAG: YnfA family protein [Saprospiraceae bacterium]|nr:YnfA family protein [Saprospiraceae bacterium]
MRDIIIYIAAAFFEIFGCFAFWNYFKSGRSIYWLIPGTLSLIVFAFLLAKVQAEFAGRAYAIYGGIYIAASLLWLYLAEYQTPDNWDLIGASICIAGALIILFMPR